LLEYWPRGVTDISLTAAKLLETAAGAGDTNRDFYLTFLSFLKLLGFGNAPSQATKAMASSVFFILFLLF
jgi:hypothetical protein